MSVAGSLALAGCSSSAKKAVTRPALPAATAASPSSTSPEASPTPTPTPSPTETHLPPLKHTPGPTRPTLHIAPPPATHPAVRVCHLSSGAQTVDGRLVILDLPATFPAPVVIDFHGGNQSAAQEHGYTGLGPAGAARGFIVATPNGTNGLWNFSGTEPLPDDAAFTQTIATLLAFAGCSNGRVYTAGISDGADMAVAAACRVPAVRAVFAVAPSITPRGACTKKPYLEVHGTADPIVPYYGSANGSFPDVPSEPVALAAAVLDRRLQRTGHGTLAGRWDGRAALELRRRKDSAALHRGRRRPHLAGRRRPRARPRPRRARSVERRFRRAGLLSG